MNNITVLMSIDLDEIVFILNIRERRQAYFAINMVTYQLLKAHSSASLSACLDFSFKAAAPAVLTILLESCN